MPEEKPKTIKLDKETKQEVLSALRDIKKSIGEQRETPKTVSEKMAVKLAETPGKGIFSALKESLIERGAEKKESFKKMLDPGNIIKSMTGGSKLAGVLAAKALGRPEEEIRKEAGMGPIQTPSDLTPSTEEVRGIGGGGVADLLKTLNVIAIRVDSIAGAMGAKPKVASTGRLYKTTERGARFLGKEEAKEESAVLNALLDIKKSQIESVDLEKKIVGAEEEQSKIAEKNAALAEEASDAARESAIEAQRRVERYKISEKPSLVGATTAIPGTKESPEGDGLFGALATTAGVIGGAKALGGALKGGYGAAKKLGGKVLEKVGLRAAQATTPALAEVGTKVAAEGAETAVKAGGKAAAEQAAKTATKEGIRAKVGKIIAKRVPKALMGTVGKSIPVLGAALGIGLSIGRLIKGDVVGAGLEAVSGLGSAATAIPATVASLVRDVYTETYGIEPERDPQRETRFPELQDMVQNAAADFLNKKGEESPTPAVEVQPKPETPSPVAESPKKSSQELSVEEWTKDVKERQRAMGLKTIQPGEFEPIRRTDGAMIDQLSKDTARIRETPVSMKGAGGNVINNVVNNTQPQTVVMSGMPQPRATESTWLRRQQQSYPAS